MSDRLAKLKRLLSEVEAELQQLPEVDPETASLLERLSGEIDEALEQADPEKLKENETAGLLGETISRFEAEHPRLTDLISRLTDAMGQLGI
ncbi:MAG TPA: hypothetical protein DCQ98_15675 [Planctomycetaceae bacterium]|nr:hypothetical protein [Planctomycetaceae bacterium]HRF00421.1 DUF4404 family protein [Pirellulaceae bacterium]